MTTKHSRGPGTMYAALAFALMVLIGAVALTIRQPPPPTVAEFAPQAVQQIKQAPSNQSSKFGSGAGGEGLLESTTTAPNTTSTTARAIAANLLKKCVGEPPRQTEDPQSPPCIAYWEGDNGGATYQGVTRDTIDVAIPTSEDGDDTSPNAKRRFYNDLRDFLNKRFQFYGRRLVFHYYRSDLGVAPPGQQADADAVIADKPFTSTFYRAADGFYYNEKLAAAKIPSITGSYFGYTNDYLSQRSPYLLQYLMPADEMFANLGEWGCKRLVGAKATHAGTPDLQALPRKVGAILQTYYDADPTTLAPFVSEMKRDCNVDVVALPKNPVRQGDDTNGQSAAVDPVTSRNAMLELKQKSVTTVFCMCQLFTGGALLKAATDEQYFPEWILSTYGPMDINAAYTLGAAPPEQLRNAFGLTFQPKAVRLEDEPFWWAVKEVDPGYQMAASSDNVNNRDEIYRPLLLLASAIQMAGPHLTAQSFADGLWKTNFPNPVHPNQAGAVGFRPHRYGMTLDGAEFWLSQSGRSPYTGDSIAVCYVAGGKRYLKGQWPSGLSPDPFFNGNCETAA